MRDGTDEHVGVTSMVFPALPMVGIVHKPQCSATVCLPQCIVGNQILYSWEFLFTDFHGHWVRVVVYYGMTVVGIVPLHVHTMPK